MDEYKKNVIKNSEYTYRDALEVSAFLNWKIQKVF